MRKKYLFLFIIISLLILGSTSSCFADADIDANKSTQSIIDTFKDTLAKIEENITKYAKRLFIALATVQFVYNMGMLLVNGKTDMQSFASALLRQIIIIGVFSFLLQEGPSIFKGIISSFRTVATSSGGLSNDIKPGELYTHGVKITNELKNAAWANTGFFHDIGYGEYFYIALICFVLYLSFTIISAIYTLALIKSYFICTAGMLFLGFGGSEWSNDIAKSTLKSVISVGAEIFVILLIAAVANTAISGWMEQVTKATNASEISSLSGLMASMAFILAVLTLTAPGLAAGLISGSAIGSGGTGAVAGMAVGAAGMAARGGLGALAGGYKGFSGGKGVGGKVKGAIKGAIKGAAKSATRNSVTP